MIDVSIVIVNYNTIELLLNAIDSVKEKTIGITYEIIVVDNNSSDNSEQIIIKKYSNDVTYIKLSENIGFGRANNEGFKIAKGRNVLCLNPDTLLINNAIKILNDYLDENENVGVVGSQLYFEDGRKQYSYNIAFPSISELIKRFCFVAKIISIKKRHPIIQPYKVASVVGASMMIRSDIISLTGGFNPAFFMYAEEDEWCYRIIKLNYNVFHIPQSKVTHLDGRSFSDSKDRIIRRFMGLDTFLNSVYSPSYVKLYYFVCKTVIVCNLLCYKLMGRRHIVDYLNTAYHYYITKKVY